MTNETSHKKVAYQPLTTLGKIDELDLESGDGIEEDEDEGGQVEEQNEELRGTKMTSSSSMTNEFTERRYQHSKGHNRQVLLGLRQLRTILLTLASILSLIFILKLITYSQLERPSNQAMKRSNKSDSEFGTSNKQEGLQRGLPIKIRNLNAKTGPQNSGVPNKNDNDMAEAAISLIQDIDNKRPEYDNYLSSIIYERDHKALVHDGDDVNNEHNDRGTSGSKVFELLDDFSYSLGDIRSQPKIVDKVSLQQDDTALLRSENYKWWTFEQRGDQRQYMTVSNYIRPMKSFNFSQSVTLATKLTLGTESFRNTLELCERWDGPISLVVYLSRGLNEELPTAITLIKFVRQCLPAPLSACMRDKLTWHLAFKSSLTHQGLDSNNNNNNDYNSQQSAVQDALSYPKYHLDSMHYSAFANTDQCPKLKADGSNASELIGQFESDILTYNNLEQNQQNQEKKKKKNSQSDSAQTLSPENVLRNVARSAAKTKFVLVTNVDLYPSLEMVPRFLGLLNSLKQEIITASTTSEVHLFAMPTFELLPTANCGSGQRTNLTREKLMGGRVPAFRSKQELVDLARAGKIRVYKEANCDKCHNFEDENSWLNSKRRAGNNSSLSIFKTLDLPSNEGNRMWQPFFISERDPNLVPYYNEALTSDRSHLMYEMCLRNRQHLRVSILDDAYQIRSTSCQANEPLEVASRKEESDMNRKQQQQMIQETKVKLSQQYKSSPNLNKC